MPISSVSVNGQNLAVNFSFADLEKKVDGSKNLGELKFGADGKLHRINNRAFFTSKNTVVTTADENRNTREVIMALLNDKFGQGTELQQNLLLEAEKILLGDDVVFRPISRDEVRQIIAELKDVNASEASMNIMTSLVRRIKESTSESLTGLLEQKAFAPDSVKKVIKGWTDSPVARGRSVNFATWSEKAELLQANALANDLRARGKTGDSANGLISKALYDALRDAGADVAGVADGTGPEADVKLLHTAQARLISQGIGDDQTVVQNVKQSFIRQILSQVDTILRNGTNGAKIPATLNLSEALSSMDVEMSRAIASLSVFLNKNAEGAQAQDNMTIFYETLETCGYKLADGQDAAFEKPGDIRGKMTLGAKPREIMDKYVAGVKDRLAKVLDELFANVQTFADLRECRKLLVQKQALFTADGLNELALRVSRPLIRREIETPVAALKEFVSFYESQERTNFRVIFNQDYVDAYRLIEGPVEDCSAQELGERFQILNDRHLVRKVLTEGVPGVLNGLGFGFPPEGLNHPALLPTNFHQLTKGRSFDTVASFEPIVKNLSQELYASGKAGQKTLDKMALNLLELGNLSSDDLAKRLNLRGLKTSKYAAESEAQQNEVPLDELSRSARRRHDKVFAAAMREESDNHAQHGRVVDAARNDILEMLAKMGYTTAVLDRRLKGDDEGLEQTGIGLMRNGVPVKIAPEVE